MTPELQKYYEEQFSMMATTGWSDLMEDLKILRSTVNDLSTVADDTILHFRKGQLDILDLLLSRKEVCAKAYEDLTDETNL